MVMDGFHGWSGAPSFTGVLLHNNFSFRGIKNALAPCEGNKDRIDKFCGTTLFADKDISHSARCQHTGCPLTLAMRQKILKPKLFPPALGGPFVRSAFRSALSSAVLSVDALSALLPPQWF